MNELYDELYNKFVDNELTSEEQKEIEILLKNNKEFVAGLEAHKQVHNSLFNIPVIKAPLDITTKVMGEILIGISQKYKKNYFFRVVIAVFSVLFLTTIIMFFNSFDNAQESSKTLEILTFLRPYIQYILRSVSNVLQIGLIKQLGSIFSLIIFLFFFFTINEHKKFKKKIKQF